MENYRSKFERVGLPESHNLKLGLHPTLRACFMLYSTLLLASCQSAAQNVPDSQLIANDFNRLRATSSLKTGNDREVVIASAGVDQQKLNDGGVGDQGVPEYKIDLTSDQEKYYSGNFAGNLSKVEAPKKAQRTEAVDSEVKTVSNVLPRQSGLSRSKVDLPKYLRGLIGHCVVKVGVRAGKWYSSFRTDSDCNVMDAVVVGSDDRVSVCANEILSNNPSVVFERDIDKVSRKCSKNYKRFGPIVTTDHEIFSMKK